MTTHRRPSASSQGWTQSTEEKTPVCVSVLTAFVPQQAVKSQIEPNEWKQTLKKEKKEKVSCFVYPSVWAYVHVAELKAQTSTLPDSEDYARLWADGCLWALGRAARCEVWKACGHLSKKKQLIVVFWRPVLTDSSSLWVSNYLI